jgi:hypothetical protein
MSADDVQRWKAAARQGTPAELGAIVQRAMLATASPADEDQARERVASAFLRGLQAQHGALEGKMAEIGRQIAGELARRLP